MVREKHSQTLTHLWWSRILTTCVCVCVCVGKMRRIGRGCQRRIFYGSSFLTCTYYYYYYEHSHTHTHTSNQKWFDLLVAVSLHDPPPSLTLSPYLARERRKNNTYVYIYCNAYNILRSGLAAIMLYFTICAVYTVPITI